jgi:hypothetical protein
MSDRDEVIHAYRKRATHAGRHNVFYFHLPRRGGRQSISTSSAYMHESEWGSTDRVCRLDYLLALPRCPIVLQARLTITT